MEAKRRRIASLDWMRELVMAPTFVLLAGTALAISVNSRKEKRIQPATQLTLSALIALGGTNASSGSLLYN